MAAVRTYREFGDDTPFEEGVAFYDAAWALVDGSAFRMVNGKLRHIPKRESLYRNSRLIFSHAGRVNAFYEQMVYQGTLSTDGKRLPDGSLGAIPIDPQTSSPTANEALRAACATLWDQWRWSKFMGLRPGHAAILGECLTELIDDPGRHMVWPQLVWPGYVTEIELDMAGNVQAYALEYDITREEAGRQVTFRYRKEVDKRSFRHFRKDAGIDFLPWDPDGRGAVVPNPYGFVPAVWDRHNVGGKHQHSISAIQGAMPALYEFNSFFSHGIDYTRKTFNSPVVVRGRTAMPQGAVIGPSRDGDPRKRAEQQTWVDASEQGGVEILQFDMGQAREIAADIKAYVLEMNPEARFWDELRQMSTLTAPGAERALGDATGLVYRVRGAMDPETVKLHQMATSMCGFRYHDDSADGWRARGGLTRRDDVFKPYTLDSYKAGDLDMSILERPVVPRTQEERLDVLERMERLESTYALGEMGLDETVAARILRDKRERFALAVNDGSFAQDFTEGAE